MLMKSLLSTLTILIFASISIGQAANTTKQDKPAVNEAMDLIEGKVVSVENGDTIIVQVDEGDVPLTYLVKLQAIDAPDIGQPYYENSRNALSKLIYKKDVKVVVNTTYAKGMVVGTVFRDGRDVGLNMLEKGFAWHYKRFAYQQPSSDRKSYADAQEYASTAGLGLWSETRPTPPWVFRGENQVVITSPASTGSGNGRTGPVKAGTTAAPPSTTSSSSGSGRKYILGPRGGCYYVSDSGSKVYVKDKSLCGVSQRDAKP